MNSDSTSNPEICALQRQIFFLLAALVVVSGTLATYVFWQSKVYGKDLEVITPQAMQTIGAFSQNQALIVSFENQLINYAKTHPDFQPILGKDGLITPVAPVAPAPAGPAPVAPAK